jgi:membrane protease YdiL (CAAX protease family)/GNAT superfamily N-acetyltransferase
VQTAQQLAGLRLPELSASVFFVPAARPDVGVCYAVEPARVLGVVQLVPARMRPAALDGASPPGATAPGPDVVVGFVQSLAVAAAHRRLGLGSALMRWCEERAAAQGMSEIWLAAAEDDAATRALHARCGFAESHVHCGNVLMRKRLAPSGSLARERQAGVDASALAAELGVQGMYCAIASAGISTLLAPFGGPSVAELVVGADGGDAGALTHVARAAADLAGGGGAAVAVLLARRDAWLPPTPAPLAATAGADAGDLLAQTVDAQLAPVRRIVRDEGAHLSLALGALALWQLAIALAEELYYRGLVQSAIQTAGLALARQVDAPDGLGRAAPELIAIGLASLLFGAVHAAWVDDMEGTAKEKSETRAVWFREAAASSLLFGTLFAVSGHRLLAPVACHALINTVPLCWRESQRLRE